MTRDGLRMLVAGCALSACDGEVLVSTSEETSPNAVPSVAVVHLFVNGQSNATGLDMPEASLYDSPHTLTRDETGWVPARAGLSGWRAAGIGAWAGRVMSVRGAAPDAPSYVDNVGWPGKSIAYFLPDSDEVGGLHGRKDPAMRNNYRIARDTWTEAGVEPTVLAWSQGESDFAMTPSEYEEALSSLLVAWRQDYPALERIVIIRTAEKACGADTTSVRAAQSAVVEAAGPQVVLVDVDDLTGDPSHHTGCHYTFSGYERLADRVLDALD